MSVILPQLPDHDDHQGEDDLVEQGHELASDPLGEAGEQNQGPNPVNHGTTMTDLRSEYKPFR
jgi:hypothetical protein